MQSTLRVVRATKTFTVSTGAYTAKDAIGSLQEITGVFDAAGQTATIMRARLMDEEDQVFSKAICALLFNENPTGSTVTDNAAIDIAEADLTKHEATIRFATDASAITDGFNDTAISTQMRFQPIKAGSTTSLWVALYTSDTPDWVSAITLTLVIDIALNSA